MLFITEPQYIVAYMLSPQHTTTTTTTTTQ